MTPLRRSGSEPVQARSPLGLRLGLAVFGVFAGAAAAVGFAVSGEPGWAALLAAIAAVAVVDAVLVIRRMRQGSRYQPGRDVPPYQPTERKRRRR
jgi:membrane protein implicated in regulation of membrane protease activity